MHATNLVLILLGGLAGAPAGQGNPSLLPKTQEGWRYERLAFPLTFAPDLKYKGFEELRFAPGMFNPQSDTYFTYIFAVRLEGEHKIDSDFVRTFLLEYYRGLCAAVGADLDPPLDLEKISVSVKKGKDQRTGAEVFLSEVVMFDAFVTGKPLTLNVEIVAADDPNAKATCLFALASPKPKSEKIWKLLYGLRPRFTCEGAASDQDRAKANDRQGKNDHAPR